MTTTQISLFDGAVQAPLRAPYQSTSATSKGAAIEALPNVAPQARKVLVYLAYRPAIEHELSYMLGIPLSSVCARVNELVTVGLVKDSGRTKLSPYGRKAVVWELTEKAAELVSAAK